MDSRRSATIHGRKTSLGIDAPFWEALRISRGGSVSLLVLAATAFIHYASNEHHHRADRNREGHAVLIGLLK